AAPALGHRRQRPRALRAVLRRGDRMHAPRGARPRRASAVRLKYNPPMRLRVADAGEIAPGTSRKFVFTADGFDTEGFIVNVDGPLHPYVNPCPPVPPRLAC